METSYPAVLFVIAIGALPASAQDASPPPYNDSLANRILDMSSERQVAYVKWYLAEGLPSVPSDPVAGLVRTRPSLMLPIMEQTIEEALNSPPPPDFRKADPDLVIGFAGAMIAHAANQQSFAEIGKLLKIDRERFARLVELTLLSARTYGNPFVTAYSGVDLHDSAIDKLIALWAETQFGDKYEQVILDLKHEWAEALVEHYGGPPSADQWASDPIASRLKPSLSATLHDDVIRLANEALSNRNAPKK